MGTALARGNRPAAPGTRVHHRGAWVDRENNRFIWTLGYDGPEGFAEANRRYWASPERAAMQLDPEDYLVSTEKTVVTRVY